MLIIITTRLLVCIFSINKIFIKMSTISCHTDRLLGRICKKCYLLRWFTFEFSKKMLQFFVDHNPLHYHCLKIHEPANIRKIQNSGRCVDFFIHKKHISWHISINHIFFSVSFFTSVSKNVQK